MLLNCSLQLARECARGQVGPGMTAGLLRAGALGRAKTSTGCTGPSEAQGSREKGLPPSPIPRTKEGTRVKDTQKRGKRICKVREDLKLGSESENLASKGLPHPGTLERLT